MSLLLRRSKQLPPPVGAEIAFAGRSNVGKSSLINALVARRNLARTSGTPGCTRQIVCFQARFGDGAVLTLADLPGYGYAKRSKSERSDWASLIDHYLLGRPTLRLVVMLVDVRRGLEEEEQSLLQMMAEPPRCSRPEVGTLLVATKIDQLPLSQQKLALERLRKESKLPVFGFSKEQPALVPQLWGRLRRSLGLATG